MRYTEEQYIESASIQAKIIDELNTELKALKKVNEEQAKQLILPIVSNRRELLMAFALYVVNEPTKSIDDLVIDFDNEYKSN
tara:strand:- start:8816 stop:9061 length:246 start_codon:yes stop_codon:yes gene_type:complete